MDRKKFIRNTVKAMVGAAASGAALKSESKSQPGVYTEKVGFNHLPPRTSSLSTKKEETMKTILHTADSRGHANHGWLDSHHTFSFANYHDPKRMHFGVLRVLNDDIVAPGRGFGTHPHDNMEIISIPLSGDLKHEDSMGHKAIIREGDIQVMSAGTGIFHSEYNANDHKEVKFLQIWLFPKNKNIEPRYDQVSIQEMAKNNSFYQVLSPNADDPGVWVHQDAWFHLGDFDSGVTQTYHVKKQQNGVYVFVLEGEIDIHGQKLSARDGYGIWDTGQFDVKTNKKSKVLLMEVPMN